MKMFDGCLIAGPNGACTKCLDGAVHNLYGQCSMKNFNCLKLSSTSNMECILCQRGYQVSSGRCINNDPNCDYYEPVNSLCLSCKQGYKLL